MVIHTKRERYSWVTVISNRSYSHVYVAQWDLTGLFVLSHSTLPDVMLYIICCQRICNVQDALSCWRYCSPSRHGNLCRYELYSSHQKKDICESAGLILPKNSDLADNSRVTHSLEKFVFSSPYNTLHLLTDIEY